MNSFKGLLLIVDLQILSASITHLYIFIMSLDVTVRKGEPIGTGASQIKKRLDREGVISDVRAKRYFEKPSQSKRRKKKRVGFQQYA